MSKLHDLLNKTALPTAPLIPSVVAPANNLNDLIARQPQKVSPPRQALIQAPVQELTATAVATMDIQLTTDVTSWPADIDGLDMSQPANQLKMLLAELAEKLVTADVGDAMQRVMVFLEENEGMADLLLPGDIGLCVKALQSSHGVMIAKKTVNKKKKAATSERTESLMLDFSDMGFGAEAGT